MQREIDLKTRVQRRLQEYAAQQRVKSEAAIKRLENEIGMLSDGYCVHVCLVCKSDLYSKGRFEVCDLRCNPGLNIIHSYHRSCLAPQLFWSVACPYCQAPVDLDSLCNKAAQREEDFEGEIDEKQLNAQLWKVRKIVRGAGMCVAGLLGAWLVLYAMPV